MRAPLQTVACIMCLLLPAAAARGQLLQPAARALGFQARLTGPGIPQNGTVDLVISVYDADLGGVVVSGPHNLLGRPIADGVVSETIDNVNSNAFDGRKLWVGVSVNGGPELTPRTPLVTVPYAMRVNRVGSAELDDGITLGGNAISGSLTAMGSWNSPAVQLMVDGGFGTAGGVADFFDGDGDQVARVGALTGFLASGGGLTAYDAEGEYAASIGYASLLDSGFASFAADGDARLTVSARNSNTGEAGGYVEMFNRLGDRTILLDADISDQWDGGATITTYNNDGRIGSLIGTGVLGDGALEIFQDDGDRGVALTGSHSGIGGGGWLRIFDANAGECVDLRGNYNGGGSGAYLGLNRVGGQTGVALWAVRPGSDGGYAEVRNGAEQATFVLRGENGSGDSWMALRHGTAERISFASRSGQFPSGGIIDLKNNSGQNTVRLIGDTGGGFGRVITSVLEITGGADLSEPFDVSDEAIEPGMVVVIDPANAGRLKLAGEAYDRKVAGVVSGAGGVNPGLVMRQENSLAAGAHNVALTGRVYCRADASNGPIEPGDLLTTSATPGHAMKVTDHTRAQGAVLGKAMTPLHEGRGLVLVLVSLQ